MFGEFSSEGAFDFAADYLNYALCESFGSYQETFFDTDEALQMAV